MIRQVYNIVLRSYLKNEFSEQDIILKEQENIDIILNEQENIGSQLDDKNNAIIIDSEYVNPYQLIKKR